MRGLLVLCRECHPTSVRRSRWTPDRRANDTPGLLASRPDWGRPGLGPQHAQTPCQTGARQHPPLLAAVGSATAGELPVPPAAQASSAVPRPVTREEKLAVLVITFRFSPSFSGGISRSGFRWYGKREPGAVDIMVLFSESTPCLITLSTYLTEQPQLTDSTLDCLLDRVLLSTFKLPTPCLNPGRCCRRRSGLLNWEQEQHFSDMCNTASFWSPIIVIQWFVIHPPPVVEHLGTPPCIPTV